MLRDMGQVSCLIFLGEIVADAVRTFFGVCWFMCMAQCMGPLSLTAFQVVSSVCRVSNTTADPSTNL